ncbi:MAG: DUF547 domain-containing protein [Deltaproteobacteria bacterium]|nr:MAG: DUF547 domain-containing protein [Deltaproteobacteria bacterium]
MRPLLLALTLLGCRQPMDSPVRSAPETVWEDYDALLQEVVTVDGYVDYDALEANRKPLDALITWFGEDRLWGRANDRGAIWLNAYNAFVLFAVLEEGRPASVHDVEGWLPFEGSGFFYEKAFAIDANRYSLWEVKQERIRLRRLDFRVHAAMSDGAMSSPPLKQGVYTGPGLELELGAQMRRWVNDPKRGVRVSDDGLQFSPIFVDYADDFWRWGGERSLCMNLAPYAEAELRIRLIEHDKLGCPTPTFDYDWSLNDVSHRDDDPQPP